MMKREDASAAPADDDFVTKTNKSRKKTNKPPSNDDSGATETATASTGAAPAATASEGISLRPRTMFTVKGRGRTPEVDATPAYRPQWSKDGDGFVSNTPSTTKDGDNDSRGSTDASRRKGKVLRYSKEELLALHLEAESPPQFLVETAIASEISLPPVSTLPFDYEELYKQWALNKNRGRGRGRTATGGNDGNSNNTSERSRSNGKWDENKWDKPKRGDDRHNGDGESSWGRGTNGGGRDGGDIWDDVAAPGGESMDLDLSSMAAAAEKFRREMDAMRDEEQAKARAAASVDDMDAFDEKLEHAAATGQFEDSDEEVAWDTPLEAELARPVEDSPLLFQPSPFDQKLAPAADLHSLRLDEPSFSLGSLSSGSFGLSGLSLEVEVQDEWFYLDPQGLQQGPFKTAEMREWFEAGYFKPNLPIRFGHDETFTPLANNFVQGDVPFAAPPRPSPKINLADDMRRLEQQRLIELQQHQQQQHQMMQLQQQQEQQRMLQFNQEEKIRLEMQRLEMARQQQNHLFQQQQQLIHQQQQQQQQHQQQQQQQQQQQHQQHQQQQMLLQQQSSWQRSQREGIMSALGIYGGGDNGLGGGKDHFQQQALQFEPDRRGSHQLDMNDPSRLQDPSFSHNPQRIDAPWGGANQRAFVEPTPQPTYFAQSGSSIGSQGHHQEHLQPEPPKQEEISVEDPWKQIAPNVVEAPVHGQSEAVHEAPITTEQSPVPSPERTVVEKKTSPNKQKPKASPAKKQPRSSDAPKAGGAWANPSTMGAASSKSLKDIQADEQRELRQSLGEDDGNLEHMGTQLKMMLGVNVATGGPQQPTQAAPVPQARPTPTPAPAPVQPSTSTSAPTAPAPSPWGRAAPVNQQLKSSKSMREILLEEERLAAERAKRAEAAPANSHWMNVVAGNAAPPAAAPKVSRLGPVPASVLKSTTRQSRTSVSGDAGAAAQRKSLTTSNSAESDASFWNFGAAAASKTSDTPSGASNSVNFGSGNIPSEFMGWCAKQIKSINGNDDLTLVEYCATLEDPGEIREYLAAYLGSTPRVSAFATEFIQRKKSMPTSSKKAAAVEAAFAGEATDANGAKKGKRRTKGQKIDPSLLNYSVGS